MQDFSYLTLAVLNVHSLYRSPNIGTVIKSRRLSYAGHVTRMVEDRNVFQILTRKPTERRHIRRPRRRWKGFIIFIISFVFISSSPFYFVEVKFDILLLYYFFWIRNVENLNLCSYNYGIIRLGFIKSITFKLLTLK